MKGIQIGQRASRFERIALRFFSALLCLILPLLPSCKPKSGSSLASLEALAFDDDVVLNACSAHVKPEVGFQIERDFEPRMIFDNADDRLRLKSEVISALTAVPPAIRDFAQQVGVRIVVTKNAPAKCRGLVDDESKANSVTDGGACFAFAIGDTAASTRVDVLIDNSFNQIRHSLVRQFGYLTAQLYGRLRMAHGKIYLASEVRPAFQREKVVIAGSFIRDVVTSEIFPEAALTRFFSEDDIAILRSSSERSTVGTSFATFSGLMAPVKAIDRFVDFVYAEAFDSYFCNDWDKYEPGRKPTFRVKGGQRIFDAKTYYKGQRNTRRRMEQDFSNTFAAFSAFVGRFGGIEGSDAFALSGEQPVDLDPGALDTTTVVPSVAADEIAQPVLLDEGATSMLAIPGVEQVDPWATPVPAASEPVAQPVSGSPESAAARAIRQNEEARLAELQWMKQRDDKRYSEYQASLAGRASSVVQGAAQQAADLYGWIMPGGAVGKLTEAAAEGTFVGRMGKAAAGPSMGDMAAGLVDAAAFTAYSPQAAMDRFLVTPAVGAETTGVLTYNEMTVQQGKSSVYAGLMATGAALAGPITTLTDKAAAVIEVAAGARENLEVARDGVLAAPVATALPEFAGETVRDFGDSIMAVEGGLQNVKAVGSYMKGAGGMTSRVVGKSSTPLVLLTDDASSLIGGADQAAAMAKTATPLLDVNGANIQKLVKSGRTVAEAQNDIDIFSGIWTGDHTNTKGALPGWTSEMESIKKIPIEDSRGNVIETVASEYEHNRSNYDIIKTVAEDATDGKAALSNRNGPITSDQAAGARQIIARAREASAPVGDVYRSVVVDRGATPEAITRQILERGEHGNFVSTDVNARNSIAFRDPASMVAAGKKEMVLIRYEKAEGVAVTGFGNNGENAARWGEQGFAKSEVVLTGVNGRRHGTIQEVIQFTTADGTRRRMTVGDLTGDSGPGSDLPVTIVSVR